MVKNVLFVVRNATVGRNMKGNAIVLTVAVDGEMTMTSENIKNITHNLTEQLRRSYDQEETKVLHGIELAIWEVAYQLAKRNEGEGIDL